MISASGSVKRCGALDLAPQLLVEVAVVVQAGQAVGRGLLRDQPVHAGVLDRDRALRGQRLQRAAVLLAERAARRIGHA